MLFRFYSRFPLYHIIESDVVIVNFDNF